MTIYIESVYIALIAVIYSVVLTDTGMIFAGLYRILGKLPEWLFYPLIGCYKCVSGQLALWGYIIIFWREYNVLNHILFVCVTIAAALVLHKLLTYIEHE